MQVHHVAHYTDKAVFASQLILIFGKNRTFISRMIRKRVWSKYSHVGVIDPNSNMIIEAMGGSGGGVKYTSIADFKKRYDEVEIKYHPGDIEVCRSNIGLEFDLWALWGQFLHLKWEDPAQLFCTEALGVASYIYDSQKAYKLNPGDFEMSSSFEPLILFNDGKLTRGQEFTIN